MLRDTCRPVAVIVPAPSKRIGRWSRASVVPYMSMHQPAAIRLARVGDFAAIRAINAESVPAVSPLTPGDLDALAAGAAIAWVAEVDGAVSAYLMGYRSTASYAGEEFAWFRSAGGDFLYVDQLAVVSRFRRRGIGTSLYEAIEALARRERVPSVACEVNVAPPNPGSMAFHRRRGFVEAGRIVTRDGRRVALLRKTLSSSGWPAAGADTERDGAQAVAPYRER